MPTIRSVSRKARIFTRRLRDLFKPEIEPAYKITYSLYGEDVILDYVFEKQAHGFYVDVGAFHPELYSNTKKLFDRGWSGINIDANIDTIDLFKRYRPDDINIHIAISDQEGEADYYKFLDIDAAGGGSGNSLDAGIKDVYEHMGFTPTVRRVMTKTLRSVLHEHVNNRMIDFLNIDIEGFDLKALQSNDWDAFRPKVIAVEIWVKGIDYDRLHEHDVFRFLHEQGYKAFSNTVHTWFFYDTRNADIADKLTQ